MIKVCRVDTTETWRTCLISIEEVDRFDPHPQEDQGRRAALAEDVKLANPELEYLASQVLLFPGDTLPDRIYWTPDGHTMADMGVVVKAIIMAEPHKGGGPGNRGPVDYRYLATIHRPLLQNILKREKLWKNRPQIVQLLEQRIKELGDTTLLAAQAEAQRMAFEGRQGRGGGISPSLSDIYATLS